MTHPGPHRHVTRGLTTLVLALTLVFGAAPAAGATPAQLAATKAEARKAQVRLDELASDLEESNEDYLAVEQRLAETRKEVSVAQGDLELAEQELADAQAQLNRRAGAIYRSGRLGWLSVFIGAADFRDLVTRVDLLRRVSNGDAAVVAQVGQARARADKTRSTLENRRAEQVVLLKQAAAKRQRVEGALAAQEDYLARVGAKLKTLIAEERARQERIAREKAAAEAAAAAARAAAAPAGGRFPLGRTFDPRALGSPHPEALAVALRFVGKTPYVWGGTTPSGFDCSGLTLYSYAQVGFALPRTSREQFRVGAFIAPDRVDLLQPGDLVFFGTGGDPGRIHHVGMYVGGGSFVHAPQTGMDVSVSSLTGRIAERGDYVGAVRP